MGVFQFLQNEIQGAGNAARSAASGVSSVFQGAAKAVAPYAAAVPQAASSAYRQTAASPFVSGLKLGSQDFLNAARAVPALAYGAAGAVTPGHTLQGNIRSFNRVVPEASFANAPVQNLAATRQIPQGAVAPVKAASSLAAGFALPLPGIGKIGALENLSSPALKLLGYTAVRAGEGAAYGGAYGLAADGDKSQAAKGAAQGALMGGLGNVLASPLLTARAASELIHGSGLGRMADAHGAPVPVETVPAARSVNGVPVHDYSQPDAVTRAVPTETRKITQPQLVSHFLDGKPLPETRLASLGNDKAVVNALVDASGNVVSWHANDPAFEKKYGNPEVSARTNPRFVVDDSPTQRDFALANKVKASAHPPLSDAELKAALESASTQFRNSVPPTAADLGKGDVPLQTELPPNEGTGSKMVPDKFSVHAKTSPDIPGAAQDTIQVGSHRQRNTAELGARADALAAADPAAATRLALSGKTDESTAAAIALTKKYAADGAASASRGDHAAAQAQYENMAQIVDAHAKNATEAGRAVQANTLLRSLSPEGRVAYAARKLQEKGLSLSGEQAQALHEQAQALETMPEGRAKELSRQKLNEAIARLIPSSLSDKVFSLFRTGLLTGFRTPGKVVISHAAQLALEQAKNVPASLTDQAIKLLFTGKRSLVATPRGLPEGAWKGTLDALDNFFHGYEAPNSGGRAKDFSRAVNFSDTWYGKIAQGYVETIGRLHGSLYKPFYGAQHLNSLMDMALTEARNQGLSGAQRESFVKDFVGKATEYAVKMDGDAPAKKLPLSTPEGAAVRATEEAKYATFQNKTRLGDAATKVAGSFGNASRSQIPFTQIPSSIAMKLVDYSPVGVAKAIIENIGKGNFDQRALSQGIGRGVTGTGIMAIGAALAKAGLVTGAYPTDKKEQARWKAEGKTENSVLVGGQWKDLASLGPAGDAIAVGAEYQKGLEGTKKTPGSELNAATRGGLGGLQTIASSPYLQQIQNISAALKDPENKSASLVKSEVGSLVPTFLGNIATATDPNQRVSNGPLQAVQAKVPGWRENLPVSADAFGKPLERSGTPLRNLTDPFYSSTANSSPLLDSLDSLAKAGYDATPLPIDKTITQYGYKLSIDPSVQSSLQQQAGSKVKAAYESILSQPGFAQTDPSYQQKVLAESASQIKTQTERDYLQSLGAQGILDAGGVKTGSPLATVPSGISAPTVTGIKAVSKSGITGGTRLASGTRRSARPKAPKQAKLYQGTKTKSLTVSNGTRLAAPKLPAVKRIAAARPKPLRRLAGARPKRSLRSFS